MWLQRREDGLVVRTSAVEDGAHAAYCSARPVSWTLFGNSSNRLHHQQQRIDLSLTFSFSLSLGMRAIVPEFAEFAFYKFWEFKNKSTNFNQSCNTGEYYFFTLLTHQSKPTAFLQNASWNFSDLFIIIQELMYVLIRLYQQSK